MKYSLYFLSFCVIGTSAFALKIQDPKFPLPKVTYNGMKAIGLGDTEDESTKASLRKLMKDEAAAKSLLDPLEVDKRTYSLVKEIQLEKEGWNVRLIKSKVKKAILDFTKNHWDEISKSTVNNSGTNKYENFAGLLKKDLKENLYIVAHGKKTIILAMDWVRVKMSRDMKTAHIIIQQDYLGDSNDLSNTAYTVKADPVEEKMRRERKRAQQSKPEPKKGIFAL